MPSRSANTLSVVILRISRNTGGARRERGGGILHEMVVDPHIGHLAAQRAGDGAGHDGIDQLVQLHPPSRVLHRDHGVAQLDQIIVPHGQDLVANLLGPMLAGKAMKTRSLMLDILPWCETTRRYCAWGARQGGRPSNAATPPVQRRRAREAE
jgi:hypothetical protein